MESPFTQKKHRLEMTLTEYRVKERRPLVLLCQNVQNPNNIGTIIRTADSFMLEKVYMTSKSWNRGAATNAHKLMPVEYVKDPVQVIDSYREQGYGIVALEQATGACSLERYEFRRKSLLIVGNEGEGISSSLLGHVDDCVVIPHLGWTESLNVAVSASIALWEYTRQHSLEGLDYRL